MFAGEEAVVGIEGGVEEVLAVELLKDVGFEEERGGLRIAGMGLKDALKELDCAGIIEVVEVLEGLPDQGIAIEGIGVGLGGKGGGCAAAEKQQQGAA